MTEAAAHPRVNISQVGGVDVEPGELPVRVVDDGAGNVNDYMDELRGFPGSIANKTGSLSGALAANTVHVELTVAGWYKLSCDVDFYWTGPGPSADITPGEACHEWGYDTPQEVYVSAEAIAAAQNFLNILRVGASTGTYFVNRKKGE